MVRATLVILLTNLIGFTALRPLHGQVISPGKLSSSHADIEGMRQCTECHELGQRGISNARCLSCHTVLKARIDRGAGYHATVARESCASCHKEHLGRDFDVARFDTATFKHEKTSFLLRGGHIKARCRQCHTPSQVAAADVKTYHGGGYLKSTFLGLAKQCESCHTADSPHGTQFGARTCDDCHDEGTWKRAPRFDHNTARFSLSGKHREVECAECHVTAGEGRVRYTGLQFASCASCHRDPHAGAMSGTCSTCHSTQSWQRIDAPTASIRFDHSRTRFPLRGAHARAQCAECHQASRSPAIRVRFKTGTEARTFARPVVQNCESCHVDPHPEALAQVAGGQSCASCHGERAWLPAGYDVARHNRTGRFKLNGAHTATPCTACHTHMVGGASSFWLPPRTCTACHTKADPHKDKFGKLECSECHTTTDFRGARFDHKFAAGRECTACHAERNPHGQQFAGRGCDQCHNTESFRVRAFDHMRTAFPLDGAHIRVACAVCHKSEVDAAGRRSVRYRPLATTCTGCHGGAP